MKQIVSFQKPEFDEYAGDYDRALNQGLSISGEKKEYFCRGRIAWLEKCLRSVKYQPRTVLDFGCGTGSAIPSFFDLVGIESITGIDPSPKCIEIARRNHGSHRATFMTTADCGLLEQFDLIFCNGVFHHIPIEKRPDVVRFIKHSLHSGGFFSFWENNPWNPGTRFVMRRIPFDRDAVPINCIEASRLLRTAGFDIIRTDFLFVFPSVLRAFRGIEPALSKLPFGAQYHILCRSR